MEQTIKWFSVDEIPKEGGYYPIAGRYIKNHRILNTIVIIYIHSYLIPTYNEEIGSFWSKLGVKENMTIEYWAELPKSPLDNEFTESELLEAKKRNML